MSEEKFMMDDTSFESLLDKANLNPREGFLTKATVLNVEKEFIHADVGLKTEALIPTREFGGDEVKIGDIIDVYIERYEGPQGKVIASRLKARREKAWTLLEEKVANNETVEGSVVEHVRGGFIVDLYGVSAFLPGSQAGTRLGEKIDIPTPKQEFKVLKMDHSRSNVIVSRRALLEEAERGKREEFMRNIQIGTIAKGLVKNITDYGAFVDIGGMDGLLHVTDMSWNRISNPRDFLKVNQEIDVKIIDFNPETQRISLGVKQLSEDPWAGKLDELSVGQRLKGKISNITDYGAFVELENGIEGLIHVSEMSWTKKNIHPSKIIEVGQEVEIQVLEVDSEKRRLSFGLKQCLENPWVKFAQEHKDGEIINSEVKNITEFGLFIGLDSEIDGMIHIGDLDWDQPGEDVIKSYKVGDKVQAKIIDIQPEKERVSLSIKHVKEDRKEVRIDRNAVVSGEIIEIKEDGIVVDIEGAKGFVSKMDLAEEKSECQPNNFKVGAKITAKSLGSKTRDGMMKLSIKAHDLHEQKKIMKEYSQPESGAVLKNILGDAFEEAQKEKK
ncbi:MAG: 30S ribosomal protein S1 [Alphaproteobacteria bacterium]|nr:30S ribosomal protein S1 [Alphaproteobacteria bacterium]